MRPLSFTSALAIGLSLGAPQAPAAQRQARFERTDIVLGVRGDLEGGSTSGFYLSLDGGWRVDVVPNLPVVFEMIHDYTLTASPTNFGDGNALSIGGGIKLSDRWSVEGRDIVIDAGETRDYVYNTYQNLPTLARHYTVLRAGATQFDWYNTNNGLTGTSSGFFVGYSSNTLLNSSAGMVGLKAVNSLTFDVLVGSVASTAPKQNKLGFRGSWTSDWGNFASTRLEVGSRPAMGFYSLLAIDAFFISSHHWF
jgi:hypothetical protein